MLRTLRWSIGTMALLVVLPASVAVAIGFQLGASKEELQLEYEVSIYDHDTERVTVTFSLSDEGRLKPINSIDLSIPSEEKHVDGGHKSDLTISMATKQEGDKQVARVHIRKDWAARAAIELKTRHLDGNLDPLTWYYHSIPLKDLIARAKPHENVQ